MKETLILRLPEYHSVAANMPVEWLLIDSAGHSIDQGITNIDQLNNRLADQPEYTDMVVVVPVDDVLLTQVSVPSKQLRQIKQALPYMIEELIAEDIEDVHLAISKQYDPSVDQIDVAVVQHTLMVFWLDILVSNGFTPTSFVIDVISVPRDKNTLSLLVDEGRVLIHHQTLAGMAVCPNDLCLVLSGLLAQHTRHGIDVLPQINVISSLDQQQKREQVSDLVEKLKAEFTDYEVKTTTYKESILEILSPQCVAQAEHGINLLQGGYLVNTGQSFSWSQWRVAASIAVIGVLSYLLLSLGGGWYLNLQANQLDSQAVALYKQLFPHERRVISPKKQMQNHLKLSSAADNSDFMSLLALAAKIMTAEPTIQLGVNQLRFNSQQGDLQFEIKSQTLEQLDQIKQRLTTAGLDVAINSATEQDNQVTGRLVVRSL